MKFKIYGRSELIKTNTVCRTYCCHDIYVSDYLRMEFFLYKKNLIEHCEKCEKTVNKSEVNREIRLSPIFHL